MNINCDRRGKERKGKTDKRTRNGRRRKEKLPHDLRREGSKQAVTRRTETG